MSWIALSRIYHVRAVVLAGVLLFALGSAAASAGTILSLAHSYGRGSPEDDEIQQFAGDVQDSTLGQIQFYIATPETWERDSSLAFLAQNGNVDVALVGAELDEVVAPSRLFELPYLVRSRDHMRVLIDQLIFPSIAPAMRERGLELLAVFDGGFRQVASKRPIHNIHDLTGVRIRLTSPEGTRELFDKLGAYSVEIPRKAAGIALRTGVVDASEISLTSLAAASSEELPYVLMTNHVYTPLYLVINLNRWSALSSHDQEAVRAAAIRAQQLSFARGETNDSIAISKLQARGVVISDLDPSSKQTLIDSSRSIYDFFIYRLGVDPDLIFEALKLAGG